MDILLNDVLHLSLEQIENSKIEFNIRSGSYGQYYIDRWLKHTEEEKRAGKCLDCSYWGWYGKQRNFRPGQMVFSFSRLTKNEWLFISAAEIVDVPKDNRATVKILNQYSGLFGRMIIECNKGDAFSRYVFNLSKYYQKVIVKEIMSCLYSGEQFEGYDHINLPYYRLKDIFEGRLLPTYYEALKSVKGIYCLTDTNNGKLYIGSATGEEGVAQRWGNYLNYKHGGNKKLIALYKKNGDVYFEKYFTFTLLEHYDLSYDNKKIINREQYWKKCLDTINNGYNDR